MKTTQNVKPSTSKNAPLERSSFVSQDLIKAVQEVLPNTNKNKISEELLKTNLSVNQTINNLLNANPIKTCEKKETKGVHSVLEAARPHNFLLTTVRGIEGKYNHSCVQNPANQNAPHSLSCRDLLSEQMGELERSAQFNYCIDVHWLMGQHPEKFRGLPLLLVHGDKGESEKQLEDQCREFPNIELCRGELPIPFGTHHTKMMLLKYTDGMRVVITTANLVQQDWHQKTQGMWVSPLLPPSDRTCGLQRSPTNFREDLVEYLAAYKKVKLQEWVAIINDHDFSQVNVALVASVPGSKESSSARWGHLKLRKLLAAHVIKTDPSWPVIGQFSSIGSMGKDKDQWLCGELLTSLAACKGNVGPRKMPHFKLVFPSVDDVRCSLEGYPAGGSIPYQKATADKQPWLADFMHRWESPHCGRTHAAPHIKSYLRYSPFASNQRCPWFLLTSANLSKSAWGSLDKSGRKLTIRSYEMGVLFLPKFVLGEKHLHFRLCDREGGFPAPVKVPPTPYAKGEDEPWVWNAPHADAPDRYGNVWVPS